MTDQDRARELMHIHRDSSIETLIMLAFTKERERCVAIADNYGREGNRLSKEFACEVADEIAARIRNNL